MPVGDRRHSQNVLQTALPQLQLVRRLVCHGFDAFSILAEDDRLGVRNVCRRGWDRLASNDYDGVLTPGDGPSLNVFSEVGFLRVDTANHEITRKKIKL